MNDCEFTDLKNRAKGKVRTMIRNWMQGNIEMQKALLTLADGMLRGTIHDKMIDSVFRDSLIAHISSNSIRGECVLFTTIFWDLIKEVLIEEAKAMQN